MTVEIGAEDLDADRRLDAGEQHVEAIADRLRPDIGEPGELQRGVHLRLQLLERHAGPPLVARLQRDGRVDHAHRRVIGGVVPRPTVPNTRSTSGNSRRILSCTCSSRVASVIDRPGGDVGM